jgi:putative thioredoxin
MAADEGDSETAAARYREALAADPGDLASRSGLAAALGRWGRWDQAAAEYARVVEAAPGDATAHRGLIAALVLGGRYGPARVALAEALRRLPRDAGLALTQVRLLATAPDAAVRDGALAADVARRVAADRDEPVVRESLALALAEAGRPEEAAEIQRALVAEAERAADPGLTALRRARLEAFERGRGWVARSPEEIVEPLGGP